MFKNESFTSDNVLSRVFSNSDMSKFQNCTTHAQRVNLFLDEFQRFQEIFFSEMNCCEWAKNDEKSVEIREKDNLQFRDKKCLEALQTYTSSIAWAKSKAVASLAYGNRSAVLAEFGLYEECLIDVNRAFQHEYPEKSKAKLLRRQREVRELLMKKIGKQILKTEIALDKRNSLIQSATNYVKIEKNEKYGRHIVAARDIKIGELLAVEEPYVVDLFENVSLCCHQCAGLCYNLIPCDNCTAAMYCGQPCKYKAYQNYHRYECLLGGQMRELFPVFMIPLKITLKAKNESVAEQKNSAYRSDRFYEISRLLTHDDKYPLSGMLKWYLMTATIFTSLKQKTTLFRDFDDFEETFKESFLLNLLRFRINAIPIGKRELDGNLLSNEEYAGGLYSLASLFNHSCYPNTFHYFEGSKIIIRALASIKKGEQCFITYGCLYNVNPKPVRTEQLQKTFFTCECRACEENWPADGGMTLRAGIECEPNIPLEKIRQTLENMEDQAPSAEINFLRGAIMRLHYVGKTLPQAV